MHVLDLVPLPQEARVSHDGEAFADHVEEFTSEYGLLSRQVMKRVPSKITSKI